MDTGRYRLFGRRAARIATAIMLVAACTRAGDGGNEAQFGTLSEAATISGGPPSARYQQCSVWDSANTRMITFGGASNGNESSHVSDVWTLTMGTTPTTWTQQSPSGTAPDGRDGMSCVWDSANKRMLIVGGYDASGNAIHDIWQLSFASGTPAWTDLTATGTPPSGVWEAASAWDSTNTRMIIFAGAPGLNGSDTNNVWQVSFASPLSPAWTQLSPTGTLPSIRHSSVAVWDSTHTRMIMYGGYDGGSLSDSWQLSFTTNPPVWTQLAPTGTAPAARSSPTGVWDAANARMIVFGGYDNGTYLNDSWQLSFATGSFVWSELFPAGTTPAARYGHTAVWDSVYERMVTFGGENSGGGMDNDTNQLSFPGGAATWTSCDNGACSLPGGPPAARNSPVSVWDSVNTRMISFSGWDNAYLGDVWELPLGTGLLPNWTDVSTEFAPPAARYGAAAVADTANSRMVVFGGQASTGLLNDLWSLSLVSGSPAWSVLSPTGSIPPAREGTTSVMDSVNDRMIMFSGSNNANDTWELTLSTGALEWTQLSPTGTPPTARSYGAAVWDPINTRMIMFGGVSTAGTNLGDTWQLSFATSTPVWTQLSPTGVIPLARNGAGAIWDETNSRMIMYAGYDGSYDTAVYGLSFASGNPGVWSTLSPSGTTPPARGYHTAVSDGFGHMIVFAGYGNSAYMNDAWILSIVNGALTWTDCQTQICTLPLSVVAIPSAVGAEATSTVTAAYGTPPYAWTISTNVSGASLSGSSGTFLTYTAGIHAGTDVVKVTDAASNTATASIVVSIPALTVSATHTGVDEDGTSTVTASGGVPPYTWVVTPDASGGFLSGSSGTSLTYTAGSTPGTDTVKVTDAASSTATVNIVVAGPMSITPDGIVAGSGLSYPFSVSGGTAPYTWSLTSDPSGATFTPATGSSTSYTAGSSGHTDVLTVTDNFGAHTPVDILVEAALAVAPTSATIDLGTSVNLTASGGAPGYSWSVATNNTSASVNASGTNNSIGNVTSGSSTGTDTVQLEDNLGQTLNVTVTVVADPTIAPSSASVEAGNTKLLTASNGITPYTWSILHNNSGCSLSGNSGSSVNYTAGSTVGAIDTIEILDAGGVTAVALMTVITPVSITATKPAMAESSTDTLTAVGGVSTYTWSISSGPPGASVSPSSGTSTTLSSGTVTGTVTVHVQDGNGGFATIQIPVVGPVTLSPAGPLEMAEGGTQQFTASGGDGPYTWSYPTDVSMGSVVSGLYTAGMTAGTDVIKATDQIGQSKTVTINVETPIVISPLNPKVDYSASIRFTATGGSNSYTWSLTSSPSGGSIVGATGTYTAGSTFNTTDVVQCKDTNGQIVTTTASVVLRPSLTPNHIGSVENYTASFGVLDGVSPFTWTIPTNTSGASLASSTLTTATFNTGSASGGDIIEITDADGVTATASLSIFSPIVVTPPSLEAGVGRTYTFQLSGGELSYDCQLSTDNSGAGEPVNGTTSFTYTAGNTPGGTDVVTCFDQTNQQTTVVHIAVETDVDIDPASLTIDEGSAHTFIASGGSLPYSWSHASEQSGGNITNLGGNGDYTAGMLIGTDVVQVTDGLGQTWTADVTVVPAVSISPTSKSVGEGANVAFTASNGAGTLTWTISPNNSGAVLSPMTGNASTYTSGPTPGIDTVTVTDANGNSASAMVTVYGPVSISPTVAYAGEGASVQFSAFGGDGTITFSISVRNTASSINSSTGKYMAGLIPGVDTVTATDQIGQTANATVNVYAILTISPQEPVVATPGSQQFTLSGGLAPFVWSPANDGSGGSVNSTGLYTPGSIVGAAIDTIEATDSSGQTALTTISVDSAESISPSSQQLAEHATQLLTVSGGVAPYTWSISNTSAVGTLSGTSGTSITYTAGATPGADTVKVVDSLGEAATATMTVVGPVTISPTTITVFVNAGTTFTASGGTGTFTFTMQANPSGGSVATGGVYTAGSISGVSDTVLVTDGIGQTSTATVHVDTADSISPATANVAKHATQLLTVSGGTGPYTWSISPDPSGATLSSTSGSSVTYTAGASTGVDTVKVVDNFGTSATATMTVVTALAVAPTTVTVLVGNGQTFTPSGGATPYDFTLSSGPSGGSISSSGAYVAGEVSGVSDTVLLTDNSNQSVTATVNVDTQDSISPSSASVAKSGTQLLTVTGGTGPYTWSIPTHVTGSTLSALSGAAVTYTGGTTLGTDTVKVVDNFGTSATATLMVVSALTVSPTTVTVLVGGQQVFTPSGGATPYTFTLSASPSGGSITSSGTYTAGTTGSVADTVLLTDSSGQSVTATVNVDTQVSISPATADVVKHLTQLMTAVGGIAPFTWTIPTNASGATLSPGMTSSVTYTAGGTLGTDTVKVVDADGISATATLKVVAALTLTASASEILESSTLQFNAAGGVTPYSYSVTTNPSNGSINSSGLLSAGANSGEDTVTVTDNSGQTATANVNVVPPLTISPTPTGKSKGGTIQFTTTGGDGTFTWHVQVNNSGGSITTSGLYTAGNTIATDTVSVADGIQTVTATVHVVSKVTIAPSSASTGPLGTVSFTASGGQSPYTFSMTSNPSGGSVTSAGAYTAGSTPNTVDVVTATDAYGDTASVNVSVVQVITISPSPASAPPLGSIQFTSDGHAPLTFILTTDHSGGNVTTSGDYTAGSTPNTTDVVTVTDFYGDMATSTITVGAGVSIAPLTPTTEPGLTITFTASGGSNTGFLYSINPNNSVGSFNGAIYTAGSTGGVGDTVVVTDSLGNSASTTVTVLNHLSVTPPMTSGTPNGQLSFTALNGQTPIHWSVPTNLSGASIVSMGTTGATYSAGSVGNVTDVVEATDNLGATATASVLVGNGVSIIPASESVALGASVSFMASGGSGIMYGYAFALNLSGGSLNGNVYTAGFTGGVTDQIVLSDSLGNSAIAFITVIQPPTLNPSSATVAPQGSKTFVLTGGLAPFTWTVSPNGSGGSVDSSGNYKAGTTANTTDVVVLTDSLNEVAKATVTVSAGVSVTPATVNVLAHGSQAFVGHGGSGSYGFTMQSQPSGGTITGAGVYTAGASCGTDTVLATDTFGNTGTATVHVACGLTVGPATITVPPRGSAMFTASGGLVPNVSWAVTTEGSSGTAIPSVNPGSGFAMTTYQAGSAGNSTDVVTVTDTLDQSATATITIGPGVTLSPLTPQVAANGTINFSASGGSNSMITFALTSHPSGGSITSIGGYTAGPNAGTTDVVVATDNLGNTGTTTISVVTAVAIHPSAVSVTPLGTWTFTATGGAGGYAYAVTVDGSGPAATVGSANGVYVAGTVGNTTDVVTVIDAVGQTASATIGVGPGVTLSPAGATVAAGSQTTFGATGGNGAGFTFMLTASPSGGSITSAGSYTAGSVKGTTDTVQATDSLGNEGTTVIHVAAAVTLSPATSNVTPGGMETFTAGGGFGAITFAVSPDNSGATITSAGVYTAGLLGGTVDTVVATDSLQQTATATVNVGSGVGVNPTSATVAPGGAADFTAVGGSGTGYQWSFVTNHSGGSVMAGNMSGTLGEYTAGMTGGVTDTIRATDSLGNNSGDVTITVVAALAVVPSSANVGPGEVLDLTTTGGLAPVGWVLTTDGSGGSVGSSSGIYTAGATANSMDVVTATDALNEAAQILISIGPAVGISPAGATVAPSGTQTFTATGGSGTGFVWSLPSDPSGGSITQGGVYTAGTTGGVTDTVKLKDSTGNFFEVQVTVVAKLAVTPASTSTAPKTSVNFSTTGGGTVTGWSFVASQNHSGGSINSGGTYTAGATPNVTDTIQATDSFGETATATIAVSAGVSITPVNPEVEADGTLTFTATGGTGSGFSWTLTAHPSGGTINAMTGVYTAGSASGVSDVAKVVDSAGNFATVTIQVVQALTISPATASVAPQVSQTFTYSGGVPPVTWNLVTNGSGGTVTGGVYQAGTAGGTAGTTDVVQVKDSLGDVSLATVTVGPTISISPAAPTVPAGVTITLTAAGGNGSYTWSFASRLSGGSLAGGSNGTAQYTAGSTTNVHDVVRVNDTAGNSATVTISVSPDLSVSPNGGTATDVAPNETIQFTASGGAPPVTWTLPSHPSGGNVNSSGLYTAGSTPSVIDIVQAEDSDNEIVQVHVTVGAGVSLTPATPQADPGGTVTLHAAGGGGGPYTWMIQTDGSVTGNFTSTTATTAAYKAGTTNPATDVITATDGYGNVGTATISVVTALTISPLTALVTPLGSQTFTGAGGIAPLTYSLAAGGSGGSVNSGTGAYVAGTKGNTTDTVTVTDAGGATASATITVGAGVTISPSTQTIQTSGILLFTASGGSGGYTWKMKTNPSGGSIGAMSGQYTAGTTPNATDTVEATDSLGNVGTTTVTVISPLTLSPLTATVTPLGTQRFSTSGGDQPLTWAFAAGANNSGGAVSSSGVYTAGTTGGVTDTVTVTDAIGEVRTAVITVTAGVVISPSAPTIQTGGQIDFMAGGGSGPRYTFTFASRVSGGSLSSGGVYIAGSTSGVTDVVEVTDSLGNTAEADVTVVAPLSVQPASPQTPPLGTIDFKATGGAQPIAFALKQPAPSGGTINALSGVYVAGSTPNVTDTVTVTDAINETVTIHVSVTAGVSITPSSPTVAAGGTQQFTASGGSGLGYGFSLSSGPSGGGVSSTGLYSAGTQSGSTDVVEVIDSLGNTAFVNVTVVADLSISPASQTVPPRGSITFVPGGGKGPYTYSVTGGSGASMMGGVYTAGGAPNTTDTVTVTDALSETASATVTVGSGVSLTPSTAAAVIGTQVTFTAQGGSGTGFTWSLAPDSSGGTLAASISSMGVATAVYTAGPAAGGTDTVQAKDSLGNVATVSIQVVAVLAITPANPVVAPRASMQLGTMGGLAPITWVLLSGSGSLDSSGQYTAGTVPGATAVVQASDALNETATATVTTGAGITITPPQAAVLPGGTQQFGATGGNQNYTWSLPVNNSMGSIDSSTGVYTAGSITGVVDTVLVTDSVGNTATVNVAVVVKLSISPLSATVAPRATQTFTAAGGLLPIGWSVSGGSGGSVTGGVYTAGNAGGTTDEVTATDAAGEVAVAVVNVTAGVTLSPPKAVSVTGGTVSFTASGGSGTGFTWSLTTNGSMGTIVAGLYTAGTTANTQDTVQVKDSLGNIATAKVTVVAPLTISPVTTTSSPLGTVTFIGSGGLAPLTYSVTAGSGGKIGPQTGVYTAGATPNTTDTITVTDSSSLTATATVTVGVGVTITPSPATAAAKGSVHFAASGGSGLNFTWSVLPNHSGGNVTSMGVYTAGATANVTDTVNATDSFGNVGSVAVTVVPDLTVTSTPDVTSVAPKGSITFTTVGGLGPFTFTVTSNPSGGSITTAGVYTAGAVPETMDTITVTDSLNETVTITITVTEGVILTPASATVAEGGHVSFGATGGSGIGFMWSMASKPSGGSVSTNGLYMAGSIGGVQDVVQATDSLGNTATATVTVAAPISVSPASPASPPRGQISFQAMGGETPYTWTLTQMPSGGSINTASGLYTAGPTPNVTDSLCVSDGLGDRTCVAIPVSAGVTAMPSMTGAVAGSTVRFNASGGSGTGYQWTIPAGENPSGGSVMLDGDYTAGGVVGTIDTLVVTDSLGNSTMATVEVVAPLIVTPAMPLVAPLGSIDFPSLVSGGFAPITYTMVSSGSGGTINSMGDYTAGSKPNTSDVVSIVDAIGESQFITVSVGAGVTVTPAMVTTIASGVATLQAQGGSGTGFAWSFGPNGNNSSGSLVPGADGAATYTAGATVSVTDVIQATDSLGNVGTAELLVQPALIITPPSAATTPLGSLRFMTMGGVPPITWSVSMGPSGGAINSNGQYTAGTVGSTVDTVLAVDAVGEEATASVSVGPGISITPPSAAVGANVSQSFTAMGGSGQGYAWSLLQDPSGGTINGVNGSYVSGRTVGGTDVVQVVDSLGNTAQADVMVIGGLFIAPTTPMPPPLGSIQFTGNGGVPPYAFTLTAMPSGGSITATGAYTAGPTGSVSDRVQVTDSTMKTASVTIAVGPDVTIQPSSPTVAFDTTLQFAAMGGSGTGYSWVLTTNHSGGTITADGQYTSGGTAGVSDVIQVTDSLGNTATDNISIVENADGGEEDAGMDGGVVSSDGGLSDGGRSDGGPDGGPGITFAGGCACRADGTNSDSLAFAVLLGWAALARAGMRRRRLVTISASRQ